ncbi:MAG: PH domain-containing protein [Verrucomicrobiota bacterium]
MKSAVQTIPLKSPPTSTLVMCAALAIIPIGDFVIMMRIAPQMVGLHVFLNGGILALIVFIIVSIRKTRFEISEKGLRIRGDMFGQFFSWVDLDVANAKRISFDAEPGLKPKWRTCGVGLPGYGSGWFRLHNKSKALIFLSNKNEAIYLPTRKDFSLLLSSADDTALLNALKEHGELSK